MASFTLDSFSCSRLNGYGSYCTTSSKTVAMAKSGSAPQQKSSSKPACRTSVAMETVAKRAPVTADFTVSHVDLSLENICRGHWQQWIMNIRRARLEGNTMITLCSSNIAPILIAMAMALFFLTKHLKVLKL